MWEWAGVVWWCVLRGVDGTTGSMDGQTDGREVNVFVECRQMGGLWCYADTALAVAALAFSRAACASACFLAFSVSSRIISALAEISSGPPIM